MVTTSGTSMRFLVACRKCERQFDATGLAAKSQFHCACGEVLIVPQFRAQDAAVIRCSSCSAPRRKDGLSCEHCGADYTLHEQDMHTICPACMTRVSDRARFCHHCAKPIVPQGAPGTRTKKGCPACGRKHKMTSRVLGRTAISVLECPRCAGLWLSGEGFDLVRERARASAAIDQPASGTAGARKTQDGRGGSIYRRCPDCQAFMNRRNYGGRSGVIIDSCKAHGLWFDARELEEILRWIRKGGEERAKERASEAERQKERSRRISLDRETRAAGAGAFSTPSEPSGLDLVGGILGALFDL